MVFTYAALPEEVSAPTLLGTGTPVIDGEFAYAHVPASISFGGDANETVVFGWGNRHDVQSSGRSGRLRILPGRLAAIEAFVGDGSYSRYEIEYMDQTGAGCAGEDFTPLAEFDLPTNSVVKRIWRVGVDGSGGMGSGEPMGGNDYRELRCVETDEFQSDWAFDEAFSVSEEWGSNDDGEVPTGNHSRASVVSFDGDPWPDLLAIDVDCTGIEEDRPDTCSSVGIRFQRGASAGLAADVYAHEIELIDDALTNAFLDDGGAWAFVDIDRNGTTDLLTASHTEDPTGHMHGLEADDTELHPALALDDYPTGAENADRFLRFGQFADVDGDGFVDLVLPMNALLDRNDAHDYPALGSGTGWAAGSTHWIRNSGSAPFLDSADLQPLNIDFENVVTEGNGAFSLGLLSDAYDACPEPPAYEGSPYWIEPDLLSEPPDTYYASDWQWQQTWARWGDYNGDGVADVAYGVHACWWNTGETFGELGTTASQIYAADGLVSVTYYGDGRGYYEDSLTPFDVGFDDVELGAECNGMTIPDSACLPFEENCETELQNCSITTTVVDGLAVLDLDRSGQPDAVLASAEYEGYSSTTESDAGDELDVFRSGGATRGYSIAAGSFGGSWLYRDDPLAAHYLDGYPSEEDRILADFNGDGFVDVLVVQDAVSPEREGLWLNTRTTALNRVTKIHDAYGGEIGLSYTTSTLKGDNPDLGWPVEVIDTVLDAAGTTEFTFEGGIYWGGEARFMGFRDAFVEHEAGSTSNLRYIVQPWGAGELALQTDRRTDGSIELLTYYSFWQIQVVESVEVANLDIQPPYYNAPREKCTIYTDYVENGTLDSLSEAQLIEACDDAGAMGLVDYEIQFAVNGWFGDEDYDLATWNPSLGDFPGWSFDQTIATYETQSSSSWYGMSGPEHTYTFTRNYPDLLANWPTELAIPGEATPPAREAATPTYDLHRETWFYYGNRTLANHQDYGDHGTTIDDVKTQYLRLAWDVEKMGAPVYGTQLWQGTTVLQDFSYTFAENTFDTPAGVHQLGPSGGRDWTYSYEYGDLTSELDPDGVGNTYERNACGLVTTRTDTAPSPGPRVETFDYDDTCRRTERAWEGTTTEWTYDEMGRVDRTLTQPNAGENLTTWEFREDHTLDIRDEVDLPDLTTVRGDSTLTETYLDVWGREIRTRTCFVTGAAVQAGLGIRPDCAEAENATQTFTGYAEDGSVRGRTGSYAQGEDAPTTWTFADERGRTEVVFSPAHTESEEDWVTTTTSYRPGIVKVEGPTGRQCSVTYDGEGRDWICATESRGSEDLDVLGRVVREYDGRGIRWNTTYDSYGRVTDRRLNAAVTVFGGASTNGQSIATYTSGDRLVFTEDALGNKTKREYDEAGRVEFVKYDPNGSETERTVESYVYGEVSGFPVVTTTDVNQNVTYSTYDGLGNWLGSIYPDGSTATAEYGTNGQVATSTDRLGAETTYSYDAQGRVKSVTNAVSQATTFEYDSAGRLLSTEDADGVTQEWTYAWSGLPLYRVDGGKDVESFVYRDDGLAESHTTNGVYAEFDYDNLGRRTGACVGAPYATCDSADGQQYAWEYDNADRITKFRRRDGGSSWLDTDPTYNNLNWRTGITHPGAQTESWAYDKIGNLKRHIDESNVQRNWSYDGWNRVTSESIPGLSGSRTFAYTFGTTTDERFKTLMTEPGGAEHTSWTDFEGKTLDMEDPFGYASHVSYDGPLAIRRWETDGTSELNWGYWYDALGQMVARAGPMDETTWDSWAESTTPPDPNASGPYGFEYSYTAAGRLATRVGANDEQTTWTWADGRLQLEEVGSTSDVDAIASIQWGYDTWGRTEARLSDGTRGMDLDRDGLGRITSELHIDGSTEVEVIRGDFDAYGTARSVARTVDSTEESAYLYETDVRGRVTEVAAYANGSLLDTVTYGLGPDGNVNTVATVAGTVTYNRSGASRRVTSVKQGTVTRGGVTTRDADGRITEAWSATSGASVVIKRDYDLLGRVAEVRTKDQNGNWEDREIERDWSGRVTTIERKWNNTPEELVEYLYTTEGWLENEKRSSWVSSAWSPDSERVHAYDDAGNRLTTHVDSTLEHEWSYLPGNQLDEDDANAVDWNVHGEIEGIAGGYEIGRNADGTEASVSDGASLTYGITRDPYGDPIATDDGTDVLSQVWGNPELDLPLVTWDSSGNAHAVVGVEGLMLGRAKQGGTWTASATDHLGSVVLDGTTWLDMPEAFGEGAEAAWSETSRHVYAGLEALPGLPLQLSRARLYDPQVGRFTSVDPIGLQGGDHRFVYTNSEPTSFVDPGGLSASNGMQVSNADWFSSASARETYRADQASPNVGGMNSYLAGFAQEVRKSTPGCSTCAPLPYQARAESDPAEPPPDGEDPEDTTTTGPDPGAQTQPVTAYTVPMGTYLDPTTGTVVWPTQQPAEKPRGTKRSELPTGDPALLDGLLSMLYNSGLETLPAPSAVPSAPTAAPVTASPPPGMVGGGSVRGGPAWFSSGSKVDRAIGGGAIALDHVATGVVEGGLRQAVGLGAGASHQVALLRAGEWRQAARHGATLGIRHSPLATGVRTIYGGGQGLAAIGGQLGTAATTTDYGVFRTAAGGAGQSAVSIAAAAATISGVGGAFGPKCFSPDTPVLTKEHGWIAIADVREADLIWSCDDQTGTRCGWRRVTAVLVHTDATLLRLEAEGEGGTLLMVDVTPEHPVFVVGTGFVEAGELIGGEMLVDAEGELLVVSEVRPLPGEHVVYNLTVDDTHTYFVGGEDGAAWVHNCGGKTTQLWRAVKEGELLDIDVSGQFLNRGSGEGKYFSATEQGAASYAKQAYRAWPHEGPYTVVRTEIQTSLLTPEMSVTVDVGGIPAIMVPDELLGGLQPTILDNVVVP